MGRGSVTAATVAVIVISLVAVAPLAHERATLDADVTVINISVTDDQLVSVTVRVQNRRDAPMDIVLFIWGQRDHRQHIWTDTNGTHIHHLPPNKSRTVTINRRKFALSTDPRQPVMVAVATPDGIRRTGTVFKPAGVET